MMQADDVISGAEPPLKLRLTHLGDGGCVLAASNWHGFLDGARLMRVLVDLSTVYRLAHCASTFEASTMEVHER